MNATDSVSHGRVDSATSYTSTKVLVAYADTYFGSRLFQQLQKESSAGKSKHQCKLIACMWEQDNVQKALEDVKTDVNSDFGDVCGMATNDCASKENVEKNVTESKQLQGDLSLYSQAATATSTTNIFGSLEHYSSTCVFWRGDVIIFRRAILEADCIIMELRQAQDVFDMMHVLDLKELEKPKRVIVLSSLLTWYATPPLQSVSKNDNASNTKSVEKYSYEEENEENEQNPQQFDPKKIEAILGRTVVSGIDQDKNDDEQTDEEEQKVELFTEDQYNRRIPHAKYYNWREAERVVASGNSDERRIRTCVVFSGLQYGEGEDVLKPFFAQVWNHGEKGLPIYGDGTQLVPTVHVRDLVTFTLRLLRTETPPAFPYVFATDCAVHSWNQMVNAMNYAFAGEKTSYVPPERFVLYNNVELFTLNMRVLNQTMQDLMPADEDWVARSGFVKCIEKVAFEYVEAHNLQPIRIAVLGPPLSGKTFAATALARYYNLPTFTMEQAIEDYKAHIAELKGRLNRLRSHLFLSEKSRREEVKKKAFLCLRYAVLTGTVNEETEEASYKETTGEGVEQEEINGFLTDDVSTGAEKKKNKGWVATDEAVDAAEDTVDINLTEEENNEVNAFVEEWYQENSAVARLREIIALMERVLTMKARVQHTSGPETQANFNLKKKKELRQKRAGRSYGRKNAADDEDAAAESQENAPFHDRALALMMRWRLSRADCRNQGYVLDGFPETVVQARLLFSDEQLGISETIEEPHAPVANAGIINNTLMSAAAAPVDMNVPPPTTEPCDEARLPSFVFILDGSDAFFLSRLAAISKVPNELDNEEKRLARFEEAMTLYRRQFHNTDYSLANFFECAKTTASSLTPGGRRVAVTIIAADKEQLLPPPPPESSFAVAPASQMELELRKIIGEPRNFGPTPLQQYETTVQRVNLQLEERQKQVDACTKLQKLENRESIREMEERSVTEKRRASIEERDYNHLEQLKAPLRLYLQRNVVPLLSKGLLEVCRTRPEDPVDFLAEWLVRNNPLDDSCFDL